MSKTTEGRYNLQDLPGGRLQEWISGVRDDYERKRQRELLFAWKPEDTLNTETAPKTKTQTWGILNRFQHPYNGSNVELAEVTLQKPEGIDKKVKSSWNKQLYAKHAQLEEKGERITLKTYEENTELNALYDDVGTPVMWPGGALTLRGVVETEAGAVLQMAQTSFPFIGALNDPEVTEIYKSQGVEKPRPPLAICTFAVTNDNYLTLTVRGDRTNMYPGRRYGQGGNPQSFDRNVVDHQADEMREEILVTEYDFDKNNFQFGAVVVDQEGLPNKTDLVGWVPVNISSEEIKRRVTAREKHPNDAVDVEFVPTGPEELKEYILNTPPTTFCPPAYAGLIVFGSSVYGIDWENDLMEKLDSK